MLLKDMVRLIVQMGYQRVPVNVSDILLFGIRQEEQTKYILLADTSFHGGQEVAAIKGMIWQIGYKLRQREPYCELLSIVITQEISKYRVLNEMEDMVWFIDQLENRLMIFENQKGDYKEVQNQVEQLLESYSVDTEQKSVSVQKKDGKDRLPVVSFILVGLNLLIYFIMYHGINSSQCVELIQKFGLLWTRVLENGEVYRLFTSMFLHFDIGHVFNNMLTLFFVGQLLEQVIPMIKYIMIYLGAGIIGGIVSMGYHMYIQENVLSVGASGAVFGLIGAMIYIAVRYRNQLIQISMHQIVLFLILSVATGLGEQNIDNAAHVGGFLGGILLAAILVKNQNNKEREKQ